MKKYCPNWIISAIAALIAKRYITEDLGLDSFANKYGQILSEHYAPIPAEVLNEAAENMLRILIEAECEEADEALTAFMYNRIAFDSSNAPRKIKGMFSSALDGHKEQKFSIVETLRDFKAFIYMYRSKPELAAPMGWNWTLIEDGEWLKDMESVEVSILDSL